jgi:hypothetical protein
MKTIRPLTLSCFVLLGAASAASAGEPLGIGVQAGVFGGDLSLGVRKDFVLGGDIHQISAQGSICFENTTVFRLDADYHFIIKAGDGRFYPLAGVDLAFDRYGVRLGANGGGGVNFMLTKSLAAFAEAKYVFSNWSGWAINAGIYF